MACINIFRIVMFIIVLYFVKVCMVATYFNISFVLFCGGLPFVVNVSNNYFLIEVHGNNLESIES